MKRNILAVGFLAGIIAAAGTHADKKSAGKSKPKPKPFQAVCPVMGNPALKDTFVLFKGRKLYFCCPGCPDQFDKTDKGMVAKAHLQLFATGQIAQVSCPLKAHDLDAEVSLTVGKQKVLFCCPGCVTKLKKLPESKQLAAVFAKIDKTFTAQTHCPVTGKRIDPDERLKHNGKMVYFHNSTARKTFQKSPGKYVAKLPQFQKSKRK